MTTTQKTNSGVSNVTRNSSNGNGSNGHGQQSYKRVDFKKMEELAESVRYAIETELNGKGSQAYKDLWACVNEEADGIDAVTGLIPEYKDLKKLFKEHLCLFFGYSLVFFGILWYS